MERGIEAQPQGVAHPAPIERRAPANTPGNNGASARPNAAQPNAAGVLRPGHPAQNQQHLSQWIDSHQSLPLDQQQRALEAEPGFNQLQPQVQERMHQRLTQLNNMSPDKRQQALARTEAMERLSQPQRQQVRGAYQQLGALPPDQKKEVARGFRALQQMPEGQRQAYMNSPQFKAQYNDQQRGTLTNLLSVAPLLPPPPAPR